MNAQTKGVGGLAELLDASRSVAQWMCDCDMRDRLIAAIAGAAGLVDWSAAPDWANYAAQDADGNWRWHEQEPVVSGFWWFSGRGRAENFLPVDPEWQGSLQKRADGTLKDCLQVPAVKDSLTVDGGAQ
ncbi:hypothetical protein [Xanthomonas translucens]|uniref:Uncharacterized protein n=1 Tax=Xanthomonas translucens pv. translucens TaxID=134875 RepID=A0ABW9KRR2_XANCT|nr:hypothetical protein [Xanthomonas translucens]QSQ34672.1 hypothetical protein ISN31_03335 [Xanthomonas translucens pv. translucens]UPU47794.1 hypothetical protein MZO50_13630 [Xanthomonas translucens pv. undulosa]WLA06519.1 hypothetical protein MO329_09715 [Xanthomonas translucens]